MQNTHDPSSRNWEEEDGVSDAEENDCDSQGGGNVGGMGDQEMTENAIVAFEEKFTHKINHGQKEHKQNVDQGSVQSIENMEKQTGVAYMDQWLREKVTN